MTRHEHKPHSCPCGGAPVAIVKGGPVCARCLAVEQRLAAAERHATRIRHWRAAHAAVMDWIAETPDAYRVAGMEGYAI